MSLIAACASKQRLAPVTGHADIREGMLTDPGSFFYVDTVAYPRRDTTLPIGMFDSGTVDLTVLDVVVRFDGHHNGDGRRGRDGIADFNREKFIYFGDQANMPYGEYAAENNLPLETQQRLRRAIPHIYSIIERFMVRN